MELKTGLAISAIALSLMLAMSFCLPALANPVASPEPIKIGLLYDRSWLFKYYGDMSLNGFWYGIEYATNGTWKVLDRPIELVVGDTAGNPDTAASEAERLILEEGVDILVGCCSSACAMAVQDVAKEYGKIFMVAPAAAAEITGSHFNVYTFRTASTTWHDALTGAKWAVHNLGKKFAFIAPDYSWGYSTVATWTAVIGAEGGSVVAVEYVPLGTTDFTPYLQRIRDKHPDVLVPVWAGTGTLELFSTIFSMGLHLEMNITSGIGDLLGLQLLGQYVVGYRGMCKYGHALPSNPCNDWLVSRWESDYPDKLPYPSEYLPPVPDLFVASPFAAAQAIVYAIEKAESTDAAALIWALEGLEFLSPKGMMYIRPEDHQALMEMYIAEVINDTSTGYPIYGTSWILRPELVEVVPRDECAPPIDPYPPTVERPEKPAPPTPPPPFWETYGPWITAGLGAIVVIAIGAAAFIYLRKPKP